MEKVPKKLSFMTSSCCPAFVKLVKSRFPEYEENISKTTSPMVSCGLYVKDKSPEAMTCFIGPCIAKKREAVEHADTIDFVLTYEELQCIFEGIGIDLTEPVEEEYVTQATAGGIGFPLTRGVQASMKEVLPIERQAELTAEYADGLENCNDKLTLIKNGKLSADYFEGMACCNGCVNGPGSLAQQGLTRVMVTKFQKAAEKKTSDQLQEAVDAVGKISFEV
jgi:iron only hydrogenase large subunit-like protein